MNKKIPISPKNVVKLLKQGMTSREIAAHYGVNHDRIKNLVVKKDLGYLSSRCKPIQLFALENNLSHSAVRAASSRGHFQLSRHGRILMLEPEQEQVAQAYFDRLPRSAPLGYVSTKHLAERWGILAKSAKMWLYRQGDKVPRATVLDADGYERMYWDERKAFLLRPPKYAKVASAA